MEGPNKTRRMTISRASFFRCLKLSLVSVLLFCAGSFVPPLGMAALLFCPTPLALLGVRENKYWMTAGLAMASIFLWFFFGPWFFLYFLLGQSFMCFGLTLPLGRVTNGSESLLFCTVTSIVSKVLFVAVVVTLTGQNPFVMDPNALRTLLAQMYSGVLAQGGQEAALFKESVEQMVTFVPYMFPSLILLSAMLDSFLNYKLCEALQRRQTVVFPPLPPLGEWRFPKSLLWALVLAFVLPLTVEAETWSVWTMLEINLKFLVNVFFFLQGVSLVWWWLSKRKIHLLLRILIIMLLSLPVLGLWVIALGVGDICLDLRTKTIKKHG